MATRTTTIRTIPTESEPSGDQDAFTAPEVFQAYFDCRQNKRNTHSQRIFESHLERNLMSLLRALNDQTYTIGRSVAFVIEHPKWREVWAAQFRDRVVHHVLYNRIADRFYRRFVHDSYACIPGRGILMGANRVHRFMRQATRSWQEPAHFLQADLANFFVSIDKDILFSLLKRHVPDGITLDLASQILYRDPVADPLINSPKWKFRQVPPHKSLFNAGDRGLPIGNLSSQFFANIYLNELDQYIKRELGIRWYGRYVDDMVLIDRCPKNLTQAYSAMQAFVDERLSIRFNPKKTQRNSVYRGINFCGYILKPYRRYVRRRTTNNMLKVGRDDQRFEDRRGWASRINSYLGMCRHASTYRLRKRLAVESGVKFTPHLNQVIVPKRKLQ